MPATLQRETIDTDVLVVGAGCGGLMAAIAAAEKGADVVLCEKGNARRSGGIIGGNDHFRVYIPEIHGPAVGENFIRTSLNPLADEDLVRLQFELSYDVLKKWESWGVRMKTGGHYEFVGHSWPGSSGKMGEPGKTNRMNLHFSDDQLCPKLEKQARIRGVRVINRVMVTELVRDVKGRVVGALGISTRESKLFVFRAKSIVLNKGAMGISSRLYPPPYLIGTTIASPASGDGVIIAYRAGAEVQNAEFTHRQVSLMFGPTSGKGTWIGVLRDSEGQPIAPPYLTKPDAEIGEPAVENPDALDRVWANGKGPVWMDPRGISEEDEKYMRWGFLSEDMHAFLQWVDQERINIRKTRFEFTSVQTASNMQTRIDSSFRTSLEGLYSISVGGLSGSAVGGMVAGEAAVKHASGMKHAPVKIFEDKIIQAKRHYQEILDRDGPEYADWREAQWALWQLMHCYALPPRRTENTLKAGINQLIRVREKAKALLKASNQNELYHCLEMFNLLDIAEVALLAAIERKESRGLSRRLDYPFENPMLTKLLVIGCNNGKHVFRWESPRRNSR